MLQKNLKSEDFSKNNYSGPDWFEKIRKGDTYAYECLFKEFYENLVNFAFQYVKDIQIAENLVQDVFLKIWNRREKLKIISNVKSYLFTSVKNHALNFLQREKVRFEPLDEAETKEYLKNPFEELEEKEILSKVHDSIEELPEKCRITYKLFIHNEFSYSEIAEIQNVSVNTVKTHMFRAVKTLRSRLFTLLSLFML